MFLIKVFIIYDTKYGNTKLAAEIILDGIKEVEDFEASISNIKEIDVSKLTDYDAIVLGAPNHMARPSRAMNKFVERLAGLNLKAKNVAVFGTYSGRARPFDRAVKKMEKMVEKKMPKLKLISPSLSVRVKGVTGPIVDGELAKCVDFGKKLAEQLRSQ